MPGRAWHTPTTPASTTRSSPRRGRRSCPTGPPRPSCRRPPRSEPAPLMYGAGTYYEKAGYWPGSSSDADRVTGMFVDETGFSFDFRNIAGRRGPAEDARPEPEQRRRRGSLRITAYVMIYCDADVAASTYFLGRCFRKEYPGMTAMMGALTDWQVGQFIAAPAGRQAVRLPALRLPRAGLADGDRDPRRRPTPASPLPSSRSGPGRSARPTCQTWPSLGETTCHPPGHLGRRARRQPARGHHAGRRRSTSSRAAATSWLPATCTTAGPEEAG